jgi:translation initiation factor IF-3
MGLVDAEPRLMGRSISMTMSPLPNNKRKRKFNVEEEELPPTEVSGSEA